MQFLILFWHYYSYCVCCCAIALFKTFPQTNLDFTKASILQDFASRYIDIPSTQTHPHSNSHKENKTFKIMCIYVHSPFLSVRLLFRLDIFPSFLNSTGALLFSLVCMMFLFDILSLFSCVLCSTRKQQQNVQTIHNKLHRFY